MDSGSWMIVILQKSSTVSEGDEINSEEAKRSPLSPNFNLLNRLNKKFGRQQRSKE